MGCGATGALFLLGDLIIGVYSLVKGEDFESSHMVKGGLALAGMFFEDIWMLIIQIIYFASVGTEGTETSKRIAIASIVLTVIGFVASLGYGIYKVTKGRELSG